MKDINLFKYIAKIMEIEKGTQDLGYTIAKIIYEKRMESLRKRKKHLYLELKAKLKQYVDLFAPLYKDSSDQFGILYNQMECVAFQRKEPLQKTVDWLFRKLEDAETFMGRLQGIEK